MNRYAVWACDCDFGVIEAIDEQEARDIACRMAGYQSERHMEEQLEHPSRVVAERI